MANFNKVILMGNLTRDVELRQTPGNQTVANIGLAVNRTYQTREGERREETTFVDCEAWGRQAEVMAQYLSKGRPVMIEGRLKLDQWQDQELAVHTYSCAYSSAGDAAPLSEPVVLLTRSWSAPPGPAENLMPTTCPPTVMLTNSSGSNTWPAA